MLKPEESGPLFLSLWKLILWALGLCYFGVVFAVPLRRQVIIREKLKFPSGTATALMIGVLHGKEESDLLKYERRNITEAEQTHSASDLEVSDSDIEESMAQPPGSWKRRIRLLVISFTISAVYTIATYFVPVLRNLPIFGLHLAENWLWTLNPSLAYVGQGIIMGPATTMHMLLGAIVGWAMLSPLAKNKGWAPGPVSDWETGSKGWIVWISLAIMLADSVISLGYIAASPLLNYLRTRMGYNFKAWTDYIKPHNSRQGYMPVSDDSSSNAQLINTSHIAEEPPDLDAPPEHLVSNKTVIAGLILSVLFCIFSIRVTFGPLVPFYAIIMAVLMALLLSIMGVRALGETDLNPVSGISKLAQLFFALIIPQSNKNSVIINLVAGAVSEAGALQAGDLMQDLKTGHLVGAAPNAQFWGQMIGSTVGAVVSALIYQLYTHVYKVPGELFQVPTGYVWIFTARLVTGKGLPPMVAEWALCAGVIFTVTTVLRLRSTGSRWHPYIPGGIAVAVGECILRLDCGLYANELTGMYNVPSFTLARAAGGLLNWYWATYKGREETPMVILASGLILGEGVFSILNLLLASLRVPHL